MFFIFKIMPDWIWCVLPALGLLGLFASHLPQINSYKLIIKTLSCTTIAVGIFILGMLHADNTWNSEAKELQAKVIELQVKSEIVNTEIKEKIIVKTQVIKTRGNDIIQYIDREVTKSDVGCKVSPEFVAAHNQAAEQPK